MRLCHVKVHCQHVHECFTSLLITLGGAIVVINMDNLVADVYI